MIHNTPEAQLEISAWNSHRARQGYVPPKRATHVAAWRSIIPALDKSEMMVRDIIERDLADLAGISGIRVGQTMKLADRVAKKVSALRTQTIKNVFRQLRSQVGNVKVKGATLAAWAQKISREDASRLDKAIRTGLIAGNDNTEIARSVVGSANVNGVDGATEVTRNHIILLARTAIKSLKKPGQ